MNVTPFVLAQARNIRQLSDIRLVEGRAHVCWISPIASRCEPPLPTCVHAGQALLGSAPAVSNRQHEEGSGGKWPLLLHHVRHDRSLRQGPTLRSPFRSPSICSGSEAAGRTRTPVLSPDDAAFWLSVRILCESTSATGPLLARNRTAVRFPPTSKWRRPKRLTSARSSALSLMTRQGHET